MYDPHQPFGSNLPNINMGNKYEAEYGETPPPGFYDPEIGESLIKPRNPSAVIKEDQGSKVLRDKNPDAG